MLRNTLSNNQSLAFDTLTHYLKPDDKVALEKQLESLDTSLCTLLAEKINRGNWQTLFNECDMELFPLHALYCLKSNLISDMSFSTSQLFYNVWTNEENINDKKMQMRFIPIFNEKGQRKALADKMIDATMNMFSSTFLKLLDLPVDEKLKELIPYLTKEHPQTLKSRLESQNHSIWSTEEKKRFYNNLQKLPSSEHSFIMVRDTIMDQPLEAHPIDAVYIRLGFNALSRFQYDNQAVRMIPSRGMMQAWLKAMYPDSTPKPVYRFGASTIRGLHNTLKEDGRDLYQDFKFLPGYSLPKVDGTPARKRYAEAELHDFYHQMTISNIPLNYRNVFTLFSDKLLEIAGPRENRNRFAFTMAVRVIDMEHAIYNPLYPTYQRAVQNSNFNMLGQADNHDERFWRSLSISFQTAEQLILNKTPDDKKYKSEQIATQEKLADWMLMNEFDLAHREIIDSILNQSEQDSILEMIKTKTGMDKSDVDLRYLNLARSKLRNNTLEGKIYKSIFQDKLPTFVSNNFIYALREADVYYFLTPEILKYLINNFEKLIKSGLLKEIEQKYMNEIRYLMAQVQFDSDEYDALMKLAIKHKEVRYIFDLLYLPESVNDLFKDKSTMLSHALAVEDMEMMIILTNDGAQSFHTNPNACISPLQMARAHDRYDILAVLSIACFSNKGWVKKHPDYAIRLHRMDAYFNAGIEQLEEDRKWAKEIINKVPGWYFHNDDIDKELLKIKNAHELEDSFLKKVHEEGNDFFSNRDNQDHFLFNHYKIHEWKKHGGKMSEIQKNSNSPDMKMKK